jgi:hypothetical protein
MASYSREDVDKLAKCSDMTQIKGKQVSTKTKKAQKENKTSNKTSRVGLIHKSSKPFHF